MRLRSLWALSMCSTLAHAFRDTSPFFLFSTKELFSSPPQLPELPIIKSSELTQSLIDAFSNCPADAYVLVSQPGARLADYEDHQRIPYLSGIMTRQESHSEAIEAYTDVIGSLGMKQLQQMLEVKCGANVANSHGSDGFAESELPFPWIYKVELPAFPEDETSREKAIEENDSYLHAVLSGLHQRKYAVFYSTTPPHAGSLQHGSGGNGHDTDSQHPLQLFNFDDEDHHYGTLHTNLKRGMEVLEDRAPGDNDDNNSVNSRPLFEKYNFFTPGIYLALFVMVILLSILYVGILAVAGLEVSYAAFNKEMGPSQQKNKQ